MRTLLITGSLLLLTACSTEDPRQPEVATISSSVTTSSSAAPTSTVEGERPRHRIDETPEESKRMIAPWLACMKANGADLDTQPNSIAGAEQWSKDHKAAGDTCRNKLPLPAWGLDSENPAYRDNMHRWVKCMNDRGMNVVENVGDSESPWHYGSSNQPADADKIERACEVEILGPQDK
ncbi:hypothetical protein SAMN05421504_101969 [Amycolatopsis xylanica]|uniref:Uncharacterized protein n=1 Tax=Amycolatopsis xylanica TaxID=589385 RepID=A0A1H2URB1_9PSEU|nr:hypothetical protein [Amycolatopsis xylanica]SDW58498.1 hypothetical protein SAMN05421504_101969 [Amycolatopsis xylanica]